MSRIHLTTDRRRAPVPLETVLWTKPLTESSFHTSIDPSASRLGPASDVALGLLRTAVAVYLADRVTPRGAGSGNKWRREIELVVDVPDPDAMRPAESQLVDLLGFLTDDDWSLEFRADRTPARKGSVEEVPVVSLFSGGIDSLCGLLLAARTIAPPHLVAHWDTPVASSTQKLVGGRASKLLGVKLTWNQVRIGRAARQRGTGERFGAEPTSRSRSLMFLALGIAAAEARGAELWIPENGYVSLNLPLAPERRGALSTRTTHPRVLDGVRAVLVTLGIRTPIRNPFEDRTKGEIMSDAAANHPPGPIASLFAETHSCAKSNIQWERVPPRTHCGVCFACLVRRGGFLAAGIPDATPYLEEMLRGTARRAAWLGRVRRLDIDAIRYAAARGIEPLDLLAAGLPSGYPLDSAADLARRGLDELAAVTIP